MILVWLRRKYRFTTASRTDLTLPERGNLVLFVDLQLLFKQVYAIRITKWLYR